MSQMRNITLTLAVAVGCSTFSAFAADYDETVIDSRWRLHAMIGSTIADDSDLDTGNQAKIGIGKPVSAYVMVDTHLNVGKFKNEQKDTYTRNVGGLDFLYFPRGAFMLDAAPVQPFVGVGLTYHEVEYEAPSITVTQSGYGSDAILGFTYELDKIAIRGEARYQLDSIKRQAPLFPDNDTFYTYAFLIGISMPFGDKPLPYNNDADVDGVPDRLDKCPNTPGGTPVDSNGCPLDSDNDGIPNFRDQCPNTPAGVKVNVNGCSIDDDRDGIPNDIDQCQNTPYGVAVNSQGCALDSDGDGVPDKIDQCPSTLPGLKVNSRGCVISQTVELTGVHFEFNKSRLMLDSKTILSKVAESLSNEPDVSVLILGHTDSVGSDTYNQTLSQQRAQSVVNYLSGKGITPSRQQAKGYGESKPIAGNDTDEGRERNRRVEMQVTSPNE
jgi:OOP family OmpA-OmpF porin